MNNFAFYSPTEFVFGKGTESQTAELVKKYKGTKVMIVYGGGSVVRSGLLDKVKKYLDEAGILKHRPSRQARPSQTLIRNGGCPWQTESGISK